MAEKLPSGSLSCVISELIVETDLLCCRMNELNSLISGTSSIPFAAAFPAPIARITVAAPVTASPPAQIRRLWTGPASSLVGYDTFSAGSISRPLVVEEISGFGEVPKRHDNGIDINHRTRILEFLPVFFCRMHPARQAPCGYTSCLLTQPLSSTRISFGLVSRSKMTPSSFAW